MEESIYTTFARVYEHRTEPAFYDDYHSFIQHQLDSHDLQPTTVLELAVGTGLLGQRFSDSIDYHGLDISREMLQIAQERGIITHQGNMADFDLGQDFPLILCIFDSLNYLEDEMTLKSCFRSVADHLEDGGLFIIDVNTPHKINELTTNFETQHYIVDDIETVEDYTVKEDKWILDIVMFEQLEGDTYERHHERHIQHAFGLDTIKNAIREAGLTLLDSYSSLDRGMLEKRAERWFFVCTKEA
jgi:SAM-dependent methyltransferase